MVNSERSSFYKTLDFTHILYDFLSLEKASNITELYNFAIGDIKKIQGLETIFPNFISDTSIELTHLLSNLPGNNGLSELIDLLINEVLQEFKFSVKKNNFVLTNGGCDGLYNLSLLLCNPGDILMYPVPAFPYWSVFYSTSVNQFPLYCYPIKKYTDHLGDIIEDKINAGNVPKAVILNDPSNPMGFKILESQLKKISGLSEKYGFYIILDNIGHSFINEDYWVGSYFNQSRLFIVDSFTKKYAATGLRLGYVIGPAELMNNFKKLIVNSRGGISNIQAKLGLNLIHALNKSNPDLITGEVKERIKLKQIIFNKLNTKYQNIEFYCSGRSIFSLIEVNDPEIQNLYTPTEFLNTAKEYKLNLIDSSFFLPENINKNPWVFRLSIGGENRVKEGLEQLDNFIRVIISKT